MAAPSTMERFWIFIINRSASTYGDAPYGRQKGFRKD